MLNKNKRAQITVFVILGIVILIAVGLYFFISSETKAPSIPTPTELETVPAEFKPVRGFVESCMFQIAEEGIKKLAAHGGYIDPLDEDYTLFAFNYNPLKPTESDVVSLSSSIDSSIIPYWYYLQGKDKGAFAGVNTWAPSISFMQLQLSSYVENHLSECLAGFTELEETGFDV